MTWMSYVENNGLGENVPDPVPPTSWDRRAAKAGDTPWALQLRIITAGKPFEGSLNTQQQGLFHSAAIDEYGETNHRWRG